MSFKPAERTQRPHSRHRGRLASEEYRSSQSSRDDNEESNQTRNVENKSNRKTTFQIVANNQDNTVLN